MSILTTWLTGVDFEDRIKLQGRYLLANTVLPRGFSGGAAVDTEGTLIGICTAEHGSGISCIRDFRDLRPLLLKAERMLLREKAEEGKMRGNDFYKKSGKRRKKKRESAPNDQIQTSRTGGGSEEEEEEGVGEEGDRSSSSGDEEGDDEAGKGEEEEEGKHYASWAGSLLRQFSSTFEPRKDMRSNAGN